MLTIDYFSDVLCIWAFGGQVRVDELEQQFGNQIELRYRFIPIFAAAKSNIEKVWKDQGGFAGFNRHLQTVAEQWPHVSCHPGLWLDDCMPASSTTPHVILKAVSLLEEQAIVDSDRHAEFDGKTRFEALMWKIRQAFFQAGQNISEFSVLEKLAGEVGIDWREIFRLVENGEAYAGLYKDDELKHQYCLQGSPSFVLNEGRQVLYGNVGYRIIEANITELLQRENHVDGASWC